MKHHVSVSEWASDLAYCLEQSGHGLEQITLASAEDAEASALVLQTARQVATAAGWPVIELWAEGLRELEALPRRGYLIIHAGSGKVPPEVAAAVAAFQHLVGEDLEVALLVLGTPKVIRRLRREQGLGWLSRAWPLNVLMDTDRTLHQKGERKEQWR